MKQLLSFAKLFGHKVDAYSFLAKLVTSQQSLIFLFPFASENLSNIRQ